MAEKGTEDPLPEEGKDDSFARPTAHGALTFGVDSNATFTATEQFHTWTFTVSAAASVELETTLGTQNLDTVMYLYKRTSPDASWGRYVERNDDASDDTAASRLELDLDAAEYRVLVKAYKTTQRGDFAVRGACTGPGCPMTSCTAQEALPSTTGYGGVCAARIAAVYQYGSIDSIQTIDGSVAERCNLPDLERRAADYYASYFENGIEADTFLEIETSTLGGTGDGGGSLVTVTDGGDESSVSFVFDQAGELLMLYWHNQSPDAQFFCRQSGAATVTLPNVESCVGALVSEIPHNGDDEADVFLTGTAANPPAGATGELLLPMQRYAQTAGTSTGTTLTVDGAGWELFSGKASRVTVKASNKPTIAYLATTDMVVLEVPAGGTPKLVCE